MTKKDQQDFEKADKCHICNKKYSEKDIRVRGPCHITIENTKDLLIKIVI